MEGWWRMKDDATTEELLGLWRRSLEEGIEAWRALIANPGTLDIVQLWGPMLGQMAEAWTRALQAGGGRPAEVLSHWKVLMETAVEAWAKVLGEVMATEQFAALMGKSLDQYLGAVGPMRKSLQAASEEFLRTMNLPSRTQITSLASQVVAMDARVEAIEEHLLVLADRLAPDKASVKPGRSRQATRKAQSPKGGKASPRSPRKRP
jgi:hypothetical protein